MSLSLAAKIFDPIFRETGFIDRRMHKSLAQIVSEADSGNFRSQRNGSLTIDHNEELGRHFFRQEPVQELAKIFTSDKFLSKINRLLHQSNSIFSIKRDPYLEIERELFPKLQPIPLSRLTTAPDHWKIPINGAALLRHHSSLQRNNNNPSFASWYLNNVDDETLLKAAINYVLAFGKIPIIPKMTFTRGYKGMFLPPHTDTLDKLASMMIYLPISDKQENSGLGTSFWLHKNGDILPQIPPAILPKAECREFISNHIRIKQPFSTGDLTIFFKSETTWHSFEYDIDDIGPRCAILVNFMVPNVLFQELGASIQHFDFNTMKNNI